MMMMMKRQQSSSLLVFIHSTFRDAATGKKLLPKSLQWSLPGKSHLRFVLPPSSSEYYQQQQFSSIGHHHDPTTKTTTIDSSSLDEFRHGIVQAYNRWIFAKDLLTPFKTVHDIASITQDGPHHFHVEWNKDKTRRDSLETVIRFEDVARLLRQDDDAAAAAAAAATTVSHSNTADNDSAAAAAPGRQPPYDVWIQGEYRGRLDESTSSSSSSSSSACSSLERIIASLPVTGNRLAYKRSPTERTIRIERYYRGMLRKTQVWDHIWDNLVALEDPQLISSVVHQDKDEHEQDHHHHDPSSSSSSTTTMLTLIGSATLNDWVMGGNLTSRLYVQDRGDSILFLRPLQNDDIQTSDRRYELKMPAPSPTNEDEILLIQDRMSKVRQELKRLRYLATLQHPLDRQEQERKQQLLLQNQEASSSDEQPSTSHEARIAAIRKKLGHHQRKRRFFGL